MLVSVLAYKGTDSRYWIKNKIILMFFYMNKHKKRDDTLAIAMCDLTHFSNRHVSKFVFCRVDRKSLDFIFAILIIQNVHK